MSKEYQKTTKEVLQDFQTDLKNGLEMEEVKQRQEKYGLNELKSGEAVSPWKILLHNLNNLIVYLLGAAAILSFYMGETIEGIAVIIALLIAVLTGFFTEYKAQKSVESLQKMIYTTTKVIRGGEIKEVESSEIVPGDLIFLEEGDSISADGRIAKSTNFACIESALTGESEAVEKDAEPVFDEEITIGDRINMVFAGTAVTRGNAYAIVTQTGMATEMGKITELLESGKKEKTPLDAEMDKLSKILIFVAFAAGIAVFISGFVTSQPLEGILHTALILAVAAIPEAMPAVSTITLSRGMKTMAEHKALVKSLPAVETLGSTSVICTDKTGTLTENQMTVEQIVLSGGSTYQVEGNGYEPKGKIKKEKEEIDPKEETSLRDFIRAGVLCSNATLKKEEEYTIIGDPTEGSLVVLAEKTNLSRKELESNGWNRIGELPFDSSKKYMVTAYENTKTNEKTAFIKGAPDVLLSMSTQEESEKSLLEEANESLAGQGMRVLAVGLLPDYQGDGTEESLQSALAEVTILGMAGIIDPPRKDVKEAIHTCQEAGIMVKMITGDHPQTASIIASEIGLLDHEKTMLGKEIDEKHSDKEFSVIVDDTAVFARVSPENKLQIVEALKKEGEIVAMTGDGVNDAPALHGADIGVAMGIRGTEVAKEASDMILTDDRFSTIVDAVREGRIIFSNIKKYVAFLFSCNMVEIMTILLSVIFLFPMPILPLHILFLNLVIDIAPAMALSFEPAEENIMKTPPRDAKSGLISKVFLGQILISGIVIGLSSFAIFIFFKNQNADLNYAQTATFTFMAVAQLLHIFNVRKEKIFGLKTIILQNKVLLGALALSFALQLSVVYLPFFNRVIGTTPLNLTTWLIIIVGASITTSLVFFIKKIADVK